MHHRRRIPSLFLLVAWATLALAGGQGVLAAGVTGAAVHPMASFAGPTWSVRDAELATGETLSADFRFSPLFGGAAMHEHLTLRIRAGEFTLEFEYETVYGAADASGMMDMVTAGSDGTLMQGRGRVDGRVLRATTTSRTDGAPVGHRSMALAGDGGGVRWIVERGEGAARARMLDAMARTGVPKLVLAPADAPNPALAPELRMGPGPAERLRPFIGTWVTRSTWTSGETLNGRNVFRMGRASGYAAVDTHARDGDGEEYHRYMALYVAGPEGEWAAHTVDFQGNLTSVPITLRDGDGGLAIDSRSVMDMGGQKAELDQTSAITGPDSFRWTVRMRQLAGGDGGAGSGGESGSGDGGRAGGSGGEPGAWVPLMDGTWTRQPSG